MHYFGTDADKALEKWLAGKDHYLAGRTPPILPVGCNLADLCNRFLDVKKKLIASSELSARTWRDYYLTAKRLTEQMGRTRLVADLSGRDFERYRAWIAKSFGPVSLGNEIQRVRTIMKFAWEESEDDGRRLIEKPVHFGALFKKPSLAVVRRHRHESGPKMLEAAELRKLIEAAGDQMKAMTLLAVNCGLGNFDLANLPCSALDLEGGWLNYPHGKTGIGRRCPLWPETIEAVRAVIASRPLPKSDADAGIVFLTRSRNRWVRVKEKDGKPGLPIDSIQKEWKKLLNEAGVRSIGFYCLRHTHRTIADDAKDQPAGDYIMGHADPSMAANNRVRISDDRLKAVAQVVHRWLWSVS
jgi:integrase